MKNYKSILFVLFFSQLSFGSFAQNNDLTKVEIIASYDSINRSVLLRWAPNTADLWLLSNEYGYTLEKYTYQRDGKLLPVPLEKTIIGEDIKPQEEVKWVQPVQSNDYAAIAAQTLFGEYISFEEAKSDIFSIVNKNKEDEARFSMALFAADQSREVAELSGLFYEDFEVKVNERYLYRIYANVEDSIVRADTGRIFFGPKDYAPLPTPQMSHAEQENGAVQLYWLKAPYHDVFSSYEIQKSTDNITFKKINSAPVLNRESGPSKENRMGVFLDTARFTNKAYYRILGKDAFGRKSAPSDTLEVEIMPEFVIPMPVIDSIFSNAKGQVFLNYSVKGDREFGRRVFLERSNKANGRYQLIQKKDSYENYQLTDTQPIPNNYYRIGIEVYGNIQYSMPSLYNKIDSIPPSKPVFDNYTITDSLLTLNWESPKESDVSGYRIYKSQFKNQEPSIVAEIKNLTTSTSLVENLKFINNERFYYLVAVDQVGNASEMSDPFKIQLPDVVPPATPIIESASVVNDTLKISWSKSSSTDIENYLIYIKAGRNNYKLTSVIGADKFNYSESFEGSLNGNYALRLVAVDSSKNEAVSKPFIVKYISKVTDQPKFNIQINNEIVELIWEINISNISTVQIYIKKGEHFNLYKQVDYKTGKFSFKTKEIKTSDIKLIFI